MAQHRQSSACGQTSISGSLSHDVLVSATAQIVSAYIVQRGHEALNLSGLMADVYANLLQMTQAQALPAASLAVHTEKTSRIAVEDSIRPDYLICLEDGKRVKMLKRYLKTNYNMTPEQYRNRWDLPESYPMVAPNYAIVRSQLAKKIGLGTRGMSMAAKRLSAQNQSHAAA